MELATQGVSHVRGGNAAIPGGTAEASKEAGVPRAARRLPPGLIAGTDDRKGLGLGNLAVNLQLQSVRARFPTFAVKEGR